MCGAPWCVEFIGVWSSLVCGAPWCVEFIGVWGSMVCGVHSGVGLHGV